MAKVRNVRNLLQTGISSVCFAMVAAGLYFSSMPADDGILLDRPGTPARLIGDEVAATAFFEMVGDQMELTMLFTEEDDAEGVFRSRVRLVDGQSHTIVVGEPEEDPARFVFHRVGSTLEMSLEAGSAFDGTLSIFG